MSRYFFHLRDGISKPDRDGVELAGRQEAWSMATKLAGTIIRDLRPGLPLPYPPCSAWGASAAAAAKVHARMAVPARTERRGTMRQDVAGHPIPAGEAPGKHPF